MIFLKQAIVVEGKYDKIKISSFIKAATIVTTDGFRVFKSVAKKKLIRFMAKKHGIVIITDSDRAGQLIRCHIKSFVNCGKIYCVYVPRILGKEKRKTSFSKEGFLGVEAMSEKVILSALERSGVFLKSRSNENRFTNLNLVEAGLSGFDSSRSFRKLFLKQLNLPEYLSTKQLLEVLNATFSVDEFKKQLAILKRRMV